VITHLWEAIHLKHTRMWAAKDWVPLCNNSLIHQSVVQQQLAKCGHHILLISHQLKGCHSKDVAEVHVASKTALQEAVCCDFQKHFKHWLGV
jgi:hypothetical protein